MLASHVMPSHKAIFTNREVSIRVIIISSLKTGAMFLSKTASIWIINKLYLKKRDLGVLASYLL